MSASTPLLAVHGLRVRLAPRHAPERVVLDGLDLALEEGESVALVGSSGAGKSTLARVLAGLVAPSAGTILWRAPDGRRHDLARLDAAARRRLAPRIALVFQDARASLDPRQAIGAAVEEVLGARRGLPRVERGREAARLLERVGLEPRRAARRPAELSGGECQRAALARALALGPRLLVLDEATASLDATVQAQVVTLVRSLAGELGCACLWIAHELLLVPHLAERVLVLEEGRVAAELASSALAGATHPALARLVGGPQIGTP